MENKAQDMKQTPIQKMIENLQQNIKGNNLNMQNMYVSSAHKKQYRVINMTLEHVITDLQSLLPYERECFVETYNDAYNDGADLDGDRNENYFTQTFKTNPQGGGEL